MQESSAKVRFVLVRTVSEVAATHVVHIPSQTTGDEGWDRFTFSIKLEDLRRKIDEKQLLLCIRFSVDGQEWWDSNDGKNYRFAFKKTQPPRRRPRMFDLSAPESPTSPRSPVAAPLPGTRGSNFGRMTGWNYPGMGNPDASPSKGVLGQPNAVSPPSRRSPLPRRSSESNRHPPSFTAPPPPDVHDHLKLKVYCAPAPPLSPPRELPAAPAEHKVLKPPTPTMVIGGQYATIPLPAESDQKIHERRRSWGGEIVEEESQPVRPKTQDSWTKQREAQSKALSPPTDPLSKGDVTIVPSIGERPAAAPELDVKNFREEPAMADVTCAVNELSIITPPSSALSSPPAHDSESGSTSGSTSTMSPASLVASPELEEAELPDVVVDPLQRDKQMEAAAAGQGGINSDSYRDFVSTRQKLSADRPMTDSLLSPDRKVLLLQQLQLPVSLPGTLKISDSSWVQRKRIESESLWRRLPNVSTSRSSDSYRCQPAGIPHRRSLLRIPTWVLNRLSW